MPRERLDPVLPLITGNPRERRKKMNRLVTILLCLFLLLGAMAREGRADTSGNLKCSFLLGSPDGTSIIVPFVNIYNPTTGVQNVTRFRVVDSTGSLVFDSEPVLIPIPARGSTFIVGVSPTFEGEQIFISWNQVADAAPPFARLDSLVFDLETAEIFTSGLSSRSCP